MSGTAKEVAREIKQVYSLDVVRIPLNRPSRRRTLPSRIYLTRPKNGALSWTQWSGEAVKARASGGDRHALGASLGRDQ